MTPSLILVDEKNAARGTATWEEAHASPGKLHRAFSIYIFRKKREELLIQRRSGKKPLWSGIWANSCCSHPRENETILDAAHRRLHEELGFDCALNEAGIFVYRADDPGGHGSEHEHVTIFRGDVGGDVTVKSNPDEVGEWKWIDLQELKNDMQNNPDRYAPWFHEGLKQIRMNE